MLISEVYQEFSNKFDETVTDIFNILSEALKMRTLFVSKTTDDTFSILKLLNHNGCIIEQDFSGPLEEAV